MIPPLPDPLLLPVVSGVELLLLCSCMQSLMDMVGYLLDTFTPQPVEDNLMHSVTVARKACVHKGLEVVDASQHSTKIS